MYPPLPSELDIDDNVYLRHHLIIDDHCCLFLPLSYLYFDYHELYHMVQSTCLCSLLSSVYQFQQLHPSLPSNLDVDDDAYMLLHHLIIDDHCKPFSSSLDYQEFHHNVEMIAFYSLLSSV